MSLIERVIKQLQVPQKVYYPPSNEKPDLKPFSVEFEYLGRCLHRLGTNFQEVKIMDLMKPTFINAVIFCLLGGDHPKIGDNHIETDPQEICDLLGINVLVIGPDEEQYTIWMTENCQSPRPYVIIYHSYDDLYYPIISLEKRDGYIFYRKNNTILQQLLPESEE